MPGSFTVFETAQDNFDVPGVQDIDPNELAAKLGKVTLIDVRQPAEFTGELGHIPGATLVVLDTLPDNVESIPKDKTVVFICRSGARSARAAGFAAQNGIEDCYNLKGGMLMWNQLGLGVEGRGEG
jgi:rhodanese-related sulfurtransferase